MDALVRERLALTVQAIYDIAPSERCLEEQAILHLYTSFIYALGEMPVQANTFAQQVLDTVHAINKRVQVEAGK